jgi:hypothetical protein
LVSALIDCFEEVPNNNNQPAEEVKVEEAVNN